MLLSCSRTQPDVLQTAYLLPILSVVCREHQYASLQIPALPQVVLWAAASCQSKWCPSNVL